jgi:prepilin-type processing-associated H-X9-DG protein
MRYEAPGLADGQGGRNLAFADGADGRVRAPSG